MKKKIHTQPNLEFCSKNLYVGYENREKNLYLLAWSNLLAIGICKEMLSKS